MKLYDFQKQGVEYALKHRYTINGCEMGLGKTVQAIAVMLKLETRTLVVCPAYLKHNWLQEIKKFAPSFDDHLVSVISYNQFAIEYAEYYTCDLIIFDEAHYLKNMPTQRTKRAHTFIRSASPDYLMLLTGTPVTNRVTEFYSLLKLCSYCPENTNGLKLEKTFNNFASLLTHISYTHTRSGFTVKKYTGLKNKKLLQKYLRGKYFRRTAKDELELPEIIYSTVYAGTPSLEDEKALEEAFKEKDLNHISVAKSKSAAMKARTAVQLITELLEQDQGPIIVYTDHKVSGQFIHDTLKFKHFTTFIHGGVSSDKRNHAVDQLNNGKLDVIIATIGSFSTGVNLTAANRIIFNDQSWVPANNMQAEKRIHRIGQGKTCFITHIVAKGVDYLIHNTLQEKMEVLKQLAGGENVSN